ncbi:MAG: hypothetical protein ABWX98_06810 [Lacisediminihabitans sp.]
MTDAAFTLSNGDQFIAIYQGGPNDGQTDTRFVTDGDFDAEITVITAVDGNEAMIDYTKSSVSKVGDEYHVFYVYDPKDSDRVNAPEDRGDRQ